MPRNVRNFWIEATIDGRNTKIATGPDGHNGGFYLLVKIRDEGFPDKIANALTIHGYRDSEGALRLTCHPEHPDFEETPGGSLTLAVPRGSGYTLTQSEFVRCRSALRRAITSGDGQKILNAVRGARFLFNAKGYPDSWSDWTRALHDLTVGDRDIREAALLELDEWN